MNEQKLTIPVLNAMNPYDVIKDERVKERFCNVYMATHQAVLGEAESFFETTVFQLSKVVAETAYIQTATGYSVYNCMLDIATWGLPISAGSSQLVYVIGGNVKKKAQGQSDKWERVMTVSQTVDGNEASCIRAKQLQRCSDVTLVREKDEFHIYVDQQTGRKSVHYIGKDDGSGLIKGGFIQLVFPDGSWEYIYNTYSEIDRLEKYSLKKNGAKKGANELYTSGVNGQADEGFAKTKFKKVALKTLPKLYMAQYSLVAGADYQEGYDQLFARGLDDDGSQVNGFAHPDGDPYTGDQPGEQPPYPQQEEVKDSNPTIPVETVSVPSKEDDDDMF